MDAILCIILLTIGAFVSIKCKIDIIVKNNKKNRR